MTLEQIDILEKDGDIIFSGIASKSGVPINGHFFGLSDTLMEVLNYLFEQFLGMAVSMKNELFQDEINIITKQPLHKRYQIRSLENKIQEQMKIKEALSFGIYRSADGLKKLWMSQMCFRMDEIIECLKFEIFAGGKIESLKDEKKASAFSVLYKYFFFADELKEIIQSVSVEGNIKLLQEKINDLEHKYKKPAQIHGSNDNKTIKEIDKKVTAPLLALFCSLINESSVCKQGNESKPDFCKKVCVRFGFEYRDRIRQNYTSVIDNYNSKKITKIKELILPLVDANTRNTIHEFIDSKKLYA